MTAEVCLFEKQEHLKSKKEMKHPFNCKQNIEKIVRRIQKRDWQNNFLKNSS
jgi:hypothetical protein